MTDPALHPSIVALVSLAANIAANHPKQGLCQLERLRGYGISAAQIDLVVDIARHIRDEAGQMLDASFDEAARQPDQPAPTVPPAPTFTPEAERPACCTPTAKGNSCC